MENNNSSPYSGKKLPRQYRDSSKRSRRYHDAYSEQFSPFGYYFMLMALGTITILMFVTVVTLLVK